MKSKNIFKDYISSAGTTADSLEVVPEQTSGPSPDFAEEEVAHFPDPFLDGTTSNESQPLLYGTSKPYRIKRRGKIIRGRNKK
jgi:hypothetical protein